jgi:hypothetical protein
VSRIPKNTALAAGTFLVGVTWASATSQSQITPFGPSARSGCVQAHPAGTLVEETSVGVRVTPPGSKAKEYDLRDSVCGLVQSFAYAEKSINYWQNYAQAHPTVGITKFSATYSVPQEPTSSGDQILYYFIGLQDSTFAKATILQPVLTFEPATGWSIAAWYCCPSSQQHHANVISGLQPGDTVVSTIERIALKRYTVSAAWGGQVSSLTVETQAPEFRLLKAALEVYRVDDCSQFARGPVTFRSIEIASENSSISPAWALAPTGGLSTCARITLGSSGITIDRR